MNQIHQNHYAVRWCEIVESSGADRRSLLAIARIAATPLFRLRFAHYHCCHPIDHRATWHSAASHHDTGQTLAYSRTASPSRTRHPSSRSLRQGPRTPHIASDQSRSHAPGPQMPLRERDREIERGQTDLTEVHKHISIIAERL